jgi:hypothetical protein
LKLGAKYLDLSYSGQLGFVETSYVFPTTHMVAPKENVVGCNECHNHTKSRLASLTGFYMPGRDRIKIVDFGGWAVILGSLGGVLLHGLGRFLANGRNKRG